MLCSVCGTSNDDAASFCRKCGSTLPRQAGALTRQPSMVPEATRYSVGKVPAVAVFFALTFGFGVGQFYNGDFKRGILIFFLTSFAVAFAIETAFLSVIAVWLWGAVNAYNVASRKTPLWT